MGDPPVQARERQPRQDRQYQRDDRVLDAFEAMQQRRKGKLTDWPVDTDDDPEDV